MKQFIKVNNTGDVLAVIQSNDPNLSSENGASLHEMVDFDRWEKVRDNPRHFRFVGKDLQEKSIQEKSMEDEKIKNSLKAVSDKRIDDLERKVLDMKDEIEKLKKK